MTALHTPMTITSTWRIVSTAIPLLTLGGTASAQSFGGMRDLGTLGGNDTVAHGVSADGSVVVGTSATPAQSIRHAFVWTEASGMLDLGAVFRNSEARGVSADGTTVVGYTETTVSLETRAFRWTAATGMVLLGTTTPGLVQAVRANAVNSDGSVVVGRATSGMAGVPPRGFRWTAATGMQDIGVPAGFTSHSVSVIDVSDDGNVLLCSVESSALPDRAFLWTQASGFTDLGTLGGPDTFATAISRDGATVLCRSRQSQFGVPRPCLWTAVSGLTEIVTNFGANPELHDLNADGTVVVGATSFGFDGIRLAGPTVQYLGGLFLGEPVVARSVSADGRVIVGSADVGQGPQHAFRWELGVPAPLGNRYCLARPNSTGFGATIRALGSTEHTDNQVELIVENLPQQSVGYFLASPVAGFVPQLPGSLGALCLGGSIGRLVGPGQIQNSGSSGSFSLQLDLTAMPTPTGSLPWLGESVWNFQAWYRDTHPAADSNLSDAVRVFMH